jgi:hypothetical protein
MSNVILLIALSVFFSTNSEAEVYSYGASHYFCGFSADRGSISMKPVELGKPQIQFYAFQVFASENNFPRFTAYNTGDAKSSLSFFQSGGIPNRSAAVNWPLSARTSQVDSYLNLSNAGKMPITFALKSQMTQGTYYSVIEARLKIDFSLDLATRILQALGDTRIPNFKTDPPIVRWISTLSSFSLGGHGTPIVWQTDPSHLYIALEDELNMLQVQLHYPPDKYNGLSYHIRFFCSNNTTSLLM